MNDKSKRMLPVMIMWIIGLGMWWYYQGHMQQNTKPVDKQLLQEVMVKADKDAKAAGDDKKKLIKPEEEYDKIFNDKAYWGTDYAASAGFDLADIKIRIAHDDATNLDNQTILNEAAAVYRKIIGGGLLGGGSPYSGKEFEAQAHLQLAELEETKLVQQPFFLIGWLTGEKTSGPKQEQAAILEYQSLVKAFPPAKSATGKLGQEGLTSLQERLDREDQKTWGYQAIDYLVKLTGKNRQYSYFLALLMITIVIKIITTPFSRMQFKSMKEMQRMAPLMKQLQEKYKDDQRVLGEKTMELYKEHGVNPFASCLPLLIQMPVLMLLYYKVIRAYLYQFNNGAFLWIGSPLAHKWPTIIGLNLAKPDIPLLVLYVISMIISQKMTVMDPSQAEQQKMMAYIMPLMFAFILYSFPSALMLYWLLFNIFSMVQQYFNMKAPSGPSGPIPVAATAGGGTLDSSTPAAGAPRRKSGKGRRRY